MEIGPDKINNAARPPRARTEQCDRGQDEPSAHARTDSVQLSGDARVRIAEAVRLDQSGDYSEKGLRARVRAHSDSLHSTDPERVQQIRDRIESGYYERDDIKQRIAGRLADELMPPEDSSRE